jgi:enamine deaminase RidA (YjgF/YER057c/UK114 family)
MFAGLCSPTRFWFNNAIAIRCIVFVALAGKDVWPKSNTTDQRGLFHNSAFSQVVAASGSRTIYTAGQVFIDERGALVGAGDLAEQTVQAMRNVGLALAAAVATYSGIVKITTYVRRLQARTPSRRTHCSIRVLPSSTPPASTLVGVAALGLPEWLVENEAIAVVG